MKNLIKNSLLFSLLSIGILLFKKLLFVKFDLFKILNVDFLLFEVGIEYIVLLLVAILTSLLSKKINQNTLSRSLITAFIFGLSYALFSVIYLSVVGFIFGSGKYADVFIFNNFIYLIPTGFSEGVLFVLVMFHLNSEKELS
jgi:hypothetical protein